MYPLLQSNEMPMRIWRQCSLNKKYRQRYEQRKNKKWFEDGKETSARCHENQNLLIGLHFMDHDDGGDDCADREDDASNIRTRTQDDPEECTEWGIIGYYQGYVPYGDSEPNHDDYDGRYDE
jgi:hypothetical protein